jgi:hypothetical protein
VYSGDANFVTSTSAALSQTVQQDATKTKLTSSHQNAVFGQSVTFTATVTASAPGSGTPTGSVEFLDGTTELGMADLDSSGIATFTTSTLVVGTHLIKAVYSGDLNFLTSTSPVLKETVSQAKTTTGLVSSANPAHTSQPVTFTATVSPVAPGGGTPTGYVTFMNGANTMGIVALSGGTASIVWTFARPGTYSISAAYGGDSNFHGSKSPTLKEKVVTAVPAALASGAASLAGPSVAALPKQVITAASLARPALPSANTVDQAIAALSGDASDTTLVHDVALEEVSLPGRRQRRVSHG